MSTDAENLPAEIAEPHDVAIFNPLDAEPVAFARQLELRSQNYAALALHLRGILVPDKDFGRIHIAKKDKCPEPWHCSFEQNRGHWTDFTLFSKGADKVLGTLGLSVNYPDDQDYRRACLQGMTLADIITKAFIVDGHGQIICEGMGAASRDECKGNLNNTLKKAAKRARMDAVLRIPSISALFEDDFLRDLAATDGAKQSNTASGRQRRVVPSHDTGARLEVYPMKPWKGLRFTELEDSALDWILREIDDKPDIRAAAEAEHARRFPSRDVSENPAAAPIDDEQPPPIEGDFDDDIPF